MKKIILKSLVTLGLLVSLQSCIMMQTTTISDIKASKGSKVEASNGGMGFLMLGVPRKIVQKAAEDLRQKGAVGNITTALSVRHWGIVQYYRVVATGYTEGNK